MNKMEQTIIRLCQEDQKYADNDRALIARIWEKEGFPTVFVEKGLYAALDHVSDADYIKRTRRRLQEHGHIKPSEKVLEKRFGRFKQKRDEYGLANIHAIKKNIEVPPFNFIYTPVDSAKELFEPVQTSLLGDNNG